MVVEARDRVGGRTRTEQIGQGTFDVGGQWIGPGQKRVHALANELGVQTFPTYTKGKKVLEVEGKVSTYKRSIPSMSVANLIQMQGALSYLKRVRKKISPTGPMTAEGAEALDGETLETWRARFVKSSRINAVMDGDGCRDSNDIWCGGAGTVGPLFPDVPQRRGWIAEPFGGSRRCAAGSFRPRRTGDFAGSCKRVGRRGETRGP
ncbi:MAG: FAD-dependent oxidoreductase, partial [Deltaproteobacteria bacterium]|nr:FAD-dependent oxidoreductase [Deltaproteobacteria bacterium]